MKYWLIKSEPDVYSIADLKKHTTTWWEGVRNYQARNFMQQEMAPGDLVLFYHSNAEPSGIAGIAKVTKRAAPDKTQFDIKSEYYDKKSSLESPRWFCVEVGFVSAFKNLIPLANLRQDKSLADMMLLQKGSRLSVQPVSKKHFDYIQKMGEA